MEGGKKINWSVTLGLRAFQLTTIDDLIPMEKRKKTFKYLTMKEKDRRFLAREKTFY